MAGPMTGGEQVAAVEVPREDVIANLRAFYTTRLDELAYNNAVLSAAVAHLSGQVEQLRQRLGEE